MGRGVDRKSVGMDGRMVDVEQLLGQQNAACTWCIVHSTNISPLVPARDPNYMNGLVGWMKWVCMLEVLDAICIRHNSGWWAMMEARRGLRSWVINEKNQIARRYVLDTRAILLIGQLAFSQTCIH